MKTQSLHLGNKTLRVLVADTWWRRMIGLSFRKTLDADGMLFLFPFRRRWPIWMLGMRFPIDLIWLEDNRIVGEPIHLLPSRNPFVALRTHTPSVPVTMALEICPKNGGCPAVFRVGRQI